MLTLNQPMSSQRLGHPSCHRRPSRFMDSRRPIPVCYTGRLRSSPIAVMELAMPVSYRQSPMAASAQGIRPRRFVSPLLAQ